MSGIKAAIEKAVTYLNEHPGEARYTDSEATARLEDGLRCRVTGPGGLSLVTDMPSGVGGGGAGPSPGWLFRAALASCDASLIAMAAAREEIELSSLEVMVDSQSDDRGILGMDASVPAGPLSMRVRVSVRGAASPERLRQLVERGLLNCPVHEGVGRAIPVAVTVDSA